MFGIFHKSDYECFSREPPILQLALTQQILVVCIRYPLPKISQLWYAIAAQQIILLTLHVVQFPHFHLHSAAYICQPSLRVKYPFYFLNNNGTRLIPAALSLYFFCISTEI